MTVDMAQFALTLGSVYALKAEDGFTLIRFPSMVISILSNSVLTGRLRSKAGEVVRGEVLKKAVETVKRKDSIQYVVTEELVEAYCGDIISEVDMDREMRLSQRIVDELLSIYM